MKIARLETFATPLIGFVRVTTDIGDQGWGQVSTYNADITCEIFHRQVAPHALGTDALDFAATIDLIGEREHKFPRLLPAPRDGGPRHRAVGSARQGRGQAGRRADRRQARAAARLWQLDAARHHARGRGRPACAAARREGLRRLQVARRRGMRPRRRRVAGPHRGDRPLRGARRSATASPSWSTPIPASRRAGDRGRPHARGQRHRPFRGALPLLGVRVDQAGRPRRWRST